MQPARLIGSSPLAFALVGALLKRPYPARGRVLGPGFDLRFPPERAVPMTPAHLDLVLRLLDLAARLGRALGPTETVGFFRGLFDGSVSSEAAAQKAAATLSLALDIQLLQVDFEALKLALTTEAAIAQVDAAIVPLISPATDAGFAALERANSNGPADE